MAVVPHMSLRRMPALFGMLLVASSVAYGSAQNPATPTFSQDSTVNQSLPPTATTTSANTLSPLPSPQERPHGAHVHWSGGKLTIAADNSSLRQILSDVASQTGMKLTGNVEDERVFGNYGPAPAAQVLTALMDGTSVNLLIVENASHTVRELVLSPRQGASTLPDSGSTDRSLSGRTDLPPQLARHPTENDKDSTSGDEGSENGSARRGAGFAQEQSPNGVKTPQQLYEDLLRARQQGLLQQGQFPGASPQPDQPITQDPQYAQEPEVIPQQPQVQVQPEPQQPEPQQLEQPQPDQMPIQPEPQP